MSWVKNFCCSFCGRTKEEADRFIVGPKGVVICNICVKDADWKLAEAEAYEMHEILSTKTDTFPATPPGSHPS